MIRDSLADNVVEELPASLCNLIQLKSLCLDNNQVNQVRLKFDLFLRPFYFFFGFIESLSSSCEICNTYGFPDSRWIADTLQESAKSFFA